MAKNWPPNRERLCRQAEGRPMSSGHLLFERFRISQQFSSRGRFPSVKTLEPFDIESVPGLPKASTQEHAGLAVIEGRVNLIFPGSSGAGKGQLATERGARAGERRPATGAQTSLLDCRA